MDANEQVNIETSAQQLTETQTTVDTTSTQPSTPKTYTQEEVDKMLQSASSKSKYEILSEMGVKSVNEFRNLKNSYDDAIKAHDFLETELNETKAKNKSLFDQLAVSKYNVSEDNANDFLTLTYSRVNETNDFDTVAKDILQRNPGWVKGSAPLRMNTDKGETEVKTQSELSKKYSWIKNN